MGWMRDNRDALVITVLGGLLVTVGGGIILSDVLPGDDGGSTEQQPVIVRTPPPAKPTVITVAAPAPPAAAAPKKKAQPPPAAQPPPPAAPPPAAPPAAQPPAPKAVKTSAGTVVPENTRVKLAEGRLQVAVGAVTGGTVERLGLQASGKQCAFTRVRVGEVVGVRVSRRGAVGVQIVGVGANGVTLKAGAKRVPRGNDACPRGTP